MIVFFFIFWIGYDELGVIDSVALTIQTINTRWLLMETKHWILWVEWKVSRKFVHKKSFSSNNLFVIFYQMNCLQNGFMIQTSKIEISFFNSMNIFDDTAMNECYVWSLKSNERLCVTWKFHEKYYFDLVYKIRDYTGLLIWINMWMVDVVT